MGKNHTSFEGSIEHRSSLPLIGRDREHARLAELLAPGRLVFVTGERGVGKTALVRAVARAAPSISPVVYVSDARTCANAGAGIAAALHGGRSNADVARLAAQLKRGHARTRMAMIALFRRGSERAIVFDHLDHPGPRLDSLIDTWRERTAVILVARSEAALGKLHRHLYDSDTITLRGLESRSAGLLADAMCRRFGLSLSAAEVRMLLQLTDRLPGLMHRTLRLRAEPDGYGVPIARLVRRAQLAAVAAERREFARARWRSNERSRVSRVVRG